MEKFTRVLRGYDPDEVNQFLDQVITQVDKMIKNSKAKDEKIIKQAERIRELEKGIKGFSNMRDRLSQYENMENTLQKAIMMAQKTSDQIKANAHKESEIIIDNAKKNATRIINESLLKAEKNELEAERLKRDINIFKRKMKDMLQTQLELVDEMNDINI